MPTILSLFDYSGNWSRPYKEAGYDVVLVDLKHGVDILDFAKGPLPADIRGVLAALPCTDFAGSGACHWANKDDNGQTAKSIELAYATLSIIDRAKPVWWALENPVGRLNTLIPELKPWGPWYFQPWHYGDPYTKKTGLWGRFNKPPITDPIKPITETNGQSWIHNSLGGKSEKTKTLRSTTPMGFAYAFFNSNP
jgi:hypothetical protein